MADETLDLVAGPVIPGIKSGHTDIEALDPAEARAVIGVDPAGTPQTPSGAAGGDLSGTYPNPAVVDDSHVHTTATLTGIAEFVRDTVGTALTSGTNITVTVDDAGDTITVAVSGLTESVQDIVGAFVSGTSGITATYDDTANTLTFSIGAGAITNTMLAGSIALSKLATDPLARANHTGTQSADTLTDGTTNKAFLATERTKLTGIATAATANSSDATLLARANHTGTQLASTVSDFTEAAQDAVAAAMTNGTGITITYNDGSNTITVAVSDAELVALAGLTSAADRLPYFTGSGTAALATFTTAGRALVDDADASAQRTTLSLVPGTDVASLVGGTVPIAQLPSSTANTARATTGAPTILSTDLAGDFAIDAVAGVLYGPLTAGTGLVVGHGWNTSTESSAAINRIAPNALQAVGMPTGWIAESFPRWATGFGYDGVTSLVSGTCMSAWVYLAKGTVVTAFGFATGSVGAGTPTHSWMRLCDTSRAQLAITSDKTTTAIPSNAVFGQSGFNAYTVATTAAGSNTTFTTTYSGWHLVELLVTASIMPKLIGFPSGVPMNVAPGLAGTTSTGLTTPPAFPATAGSMTFVGVALPYVGVLGT